MEIIQTTTADGVVLKGLLTNPKNDTKNIIIHIHGMSGDIYSNSFYPIMHCEYPDNGWAFLATENRGSSSIRIFDSSKGEVVIGNTFEIFEDCIFDIEAWINKVVELGFENIWLQSHSLGTSKVAYYMFNKNDKRVKGIVWLSPSDMLGLVQDPIGKADHDICYKQAIELLSINNPNQILDHKLWGSYMLSAGTYINLFGDNANTAIFNYGNESLGWKVVNSIKVPVLAITGTKDDGILPVMNPSDGMKLLESKLMNSKRIKTVVFNGSAHDYAGFEKQITKEVISFVSSSTL